MPFNKTGLDPRAMQQHPRFSSTPRYNGSHNPRTYRSMYDKTFGAGASGKSAWGVNRSVITSESSSTRSKLAAKEVSVLGLIFAVISVASESFSYISIFFRIISSQRWTENFSKLLSSALLFDSYNAYTYNSTVSVNTIR